MESIWLWAVLVVAFVIIYHRFGSLAAENEVQRNSIALLREELDELREQLGALTDDVERVTLTPDELQKKHFGRLPALTSDQFVNLGCGDRLSLILESFGSFRAVEYVHQELVYRTPGNKDAVAHGKARLDSAGELRDARILFSRPNSTATLRGLSDDGHVKEGRLFPNHSFKPTPLRGSA